MRKQALTLIILILIIVSIAIIERYNTKHQANHTRNTSHIFKLVSLSPAITELVYSLQLDSNLAGVTRYCDYPPDAKTKQNIGGYYDPNLELIAQISPRYVLVSSEHKSVAEKLHTLNIQSVTLDTSSPAKILQSYIILGKLFGKEELANQLVADIKKRLQQIKDITRELPKPTVMIVIGQGMSGNTNNKIYIVGDDSFYNPILEVAGGVNVALNIASPYPMVSPESIIHLNPDIIIELIEDDNTGVISENIYDKWSDIAMVNAVRNKRIYQLRNDYIFIPGPRFIKIAEEFCRILHPANTENL